jgi:hypothetical protein
MDQGLRGEEEKLPQQPLQTSLAAEQWHEGLMSIATKAAPQAGREDHESPGHPLTQSGATLHGHFVRLLSNTLRIHTNKPNLNQNPRKESPSQRATDTRE